MRYSPYEHEYEAVINMTESELLEYFLTRVFETEEVWGLDDGTEWIMREQSAQACMPVWPYKKFASESAVGHWRDFHPQAESLENFLQNTVAMLVEENAMLEVMPRQLAGGCLISPLQLKSILDGMIEAGTYTMDG
jgi:hypothetical protein